MQARRLALAHHHATGKLGEIFAGADLGEQAFHFAEPALALHTPRIAGELDNRLDVGGDPGQAVYRVLLAFERGVVELVASGDLGGHALDCAVAQGGGSVRCLVEKRDQLLCGWGHGCSDSQGQGSWLKARDFRAHRSVPRAGSQT